MFDLDDERLRSETLESIGLKEKYWYQLIEDSSDDETSTVHKYVYKILHINKC